MTHELRIIDANFNRAREALRVMEEYARFVLDDAALTESIKKTRHDLADVVGRVAGDEPITAHRDIEGDVGRSVAVRSEYERASALDVAIAAAKRASEALRAIEEYGKTINADAAADVERLRYRTYELDRRLTMTVRARERFGSVRLYVIVTGAICRGDWLNVAEEALRGGANCIQLREQNLTDNELLDRAKRLSSLCREHDALFIMNDRPDIAVLSGADGVHVGQDDLPVAAVRRVIPSTMLVGVSTHTIEQVGVAAAQAPDYIAVGPMFASSTKPQQHVPGPSLLAEARKITSLPLVAIGGIDTDNIAELLSAAGGSRCCFAACSAVVSQPDVTGSCSHMLQLVR